MNSGSARRCAVLVAAFALAGCARSTSTAPEASPPRVVAITTLDTFRFDPDRLEVRKGERVRFEISNPGAQPHEFFLAAEDVQKEHGEEMKAAGGSPMPSMDGHGMDMDESMASLYLEPGKTMEVTVTFEDASDVQFACHVPGHYEAGMVGTVEVT